MRDHLARTRRAEAYEIREEAAKLAYLRPHPRHENNGEEALYRNAQNQLSYIANYTKGLPHNNDGEVDPPEAYRTLLRALSSGDPHDFDQIELAPIPPTERQRRLINPQAGLAFDLEGPDSHSLWTPPAPRITSPRASAEMAELYWMAVLRDLPFRNFAGNPPLVQQAVTSLQDIGNDLGLPDLSQVTQDNLFRGSLPGDRVGPYLSQFLLKTVPYGPYSIRQRQNTPQPNTDFMTDLVEWRSIQDGIEPTSSLEDFLDPQRFYIRNLRDLAYHVRIDASYQHYLNACLILQQMNMPPTTVIPCLSGPIDPGNPYFPPGPRPLAPLTEEGLVTFGNWHIQTLLAEATTRALKAAWFQKWFVHRRLRPEALGGLIHLNIDQGAGYPVHPRIINELTDNNRLGRHFVPPPAGAEFATYLLPQAYPEGSPLHPSYPAGHASLAGACVTILKTWFDESYEIQDPQQVNAAGDDLEPYVGGDTLTVGGELNKLASNVSLGRSAGGVHYRLDSNVSLRLGEEVAIGILEEQKPTYNEHHYFTLTRFDGTSITI
jgi:hypothetical protein